MRENLALEEISKVLIVATSAYRCSHNRQELSQVILESSQLIINEISGQYEAQVIRNALLEKLSLKPKKYLFFDIGGGSVELSFIRQKKCIESQSFPLGTVRMMEVISKGELKNFLKEYRKMMRSFLRSHLEKDEPIQVIGTGGNFRYLLKFKRKYIKKDSNSLSRDDVEHIYRVMIDCSQREREKIFSMRADRADVIVPALEIMRFVFDMIIVSKIKTPDIGLLDGLFSIIDDSDLTQHL